MPGTHAGTIEYRGTQDNPNRARHGVRTDQDGCHVPQARHHLRRSRGARWYRRLRGHRARSSQPPAAVEGVFGTGGVNSGIALSGDGRYEAFTSTSTNLVPLDTNNQADVFLPRSHRRCSAPPVSGDGRSSRSCRRPRRSSPATRTSAPSSSAAFGSDRDERRTEHARGRWRRLPGDDRGHELPAGARTCASPATASRRWSTPSPTPRSPRPSRSRSALRPGRSTFATVRPRSRRRGSVRRMPHGHVTGRCGSASRSPADTVRSRSASRS